MSSSESSGTGSGLANFVTGPLPPDALRFPLERGVVVEADAFELGRRPDPPLLLLDDVPGLVRQMPFLAGT